MTTRVIGTSELVLPAHATMRRHPPRPPQDQESNYLELFDSQTVFCDVFQSGSDVVMVGPPLLNLHEAFIGAEWRIDGERTNAFETTALDRAERSRLADVGHVDNVEVTYGEQHQSIRVRSDQNHLLEGRRVLLAMQRNNPLHWLREWASVYASVNQVDAVVLYDLNSTHYRNTDIADAFRDIAGIEIVIVVPWPFKYGVQPSKPGDRWDSDFGQYVAWEHARRRFLQRAEAVTVADVDEIFLAEDGRSIFEHAAESESGVVRFNQRFIEPDVEREPTGERSVSYRDYVYFDPTKRIGTPKYAALLGKLEDRHQLLVHSVAGDFSPHTDAIIGRQFLPIKLAWQRGTFDRKYPDVSLDPSTRVRDEVLAAAFARTFA